ncbi:FecR family protein [Pseudomonas sp. JQ170]|uniref:FecR family protein n=1 Tax=unclassified Pseudomonas TaxID=196821 RepID=UPI00264AECEA|nr:MULTISPECIES: FecR family protein [unclassified Pseudomonas]MDN7143698.1 FecR family protein [Pseudomonas sp. JQ170]WRO74133.1 FecR family protein [Pseudomonas sp. 170C]
MTRAGRPELPDEVLDQAITWMVRLQSGYADEQAVQGCLHWRQLHPLHEAAWQALQSNESTFDSLASLPGVPGGVARDTLERMQHRPLGRRRLLQVLGTGLVIGGMGWQSQEAVRHWGADYSTAVGERRTVVLADGTRLQLNTHTAVDVTFNASQRLIKLLHGEIFIDTGPDDGSPGGRRSFWVHTAQARLQALGTAFSVRQDETSTRLRVEHSRVAIHQPAQQQTVAAGEEYSIDAEGSRKLQHSEMDPSAWTRGQLVARSMPLQALVAELARYQRGWLGCDRQIAGLEVSGVFQLGDIDRALDALGDSLPVRVERFTPWWRRVVAR